MMKKLLTFFTIVSILCFIGLVVFVQQAVPSGLSTTAVNEAVMDAMDAIYEADHASALEILLDQITIEVEQTNQANLSSNRTILWVVGIYQVIFILAFLFLHRYYKKRIIDPFAKLKDFAKNIAMGDFDIPLETDKHNLFGDFTGSFDLLREELKNAKENEREADRRKKELVASISHDIKTPVAAIKATTELMLIRDHDEKTNHQLQEMFNKAEQITILVNDMFHATLQDLQALKVNVIELSSTTLVQLIRSSDYKKLIEHVQIPNCVLLGDPVRVEQVFDNIIGNSYKYANTKIELTAHFEGAMLVVTFRDFGDGADDEEFPLLFNKFYRGKGTSEMSGYGLGLYMAKHLLQEMSGDVLLSNGDPGFVVKVILMLA